MRTTLLILLGMAILLSCAKQQSEPPTKHYVFSYFKGNGEDGLHLAYSTDGLKWRSLNNDRSFITPQVGKDKLMRDPSIVLGPDNLFHMTWTVSWHEKSIGHASSPDLINWSEQQDIPVMAHEEGARNCWAPELFYDEATGQYLMFWATTIPGRFPDGDGQDARGEDPGWNHRMYYITTKDFKTFSETRLFYEQGFNVIDVFMFRPGLEGKAPYAILLKDETNQPFTPQKNIRLAFGEAAEGPFGPPTAKITGDYWAEGPTAIKIGGEWLVYFDQYIDHHYGVISSPDLENWTDRTAELHMPEGMRHGTVFEVSEEVAGKLLGL